MHTYRVDVSRDGKWWMITVPELASHVDASGYIDGSDITQARRLAEVPTQAIDLICLVTGSEPSEFNIRFTVPA